MAIDVNIPSQVKNYANLAAFPATGSLKTIFIAEDTNKTYRWTGSAYVEISATAASTWGAIGGTLSNQTDLQTALNAKVTGNTAITGATKTKITYDSKGLVTSGTDATTADIADSLNKRYVTDANLTVIGNTSGVNTGDQTLSGLGGVPTSRTLTINGTTQDLSADRTFTISTGITIGTTAITSGTVGRVLFEGAGNVVQESGNLFWDNTNGRLGIGTSNPTIKLSITHSDNNYLEGISINNTNTGTQALSGLSFTVNSVTGGFMSYNPSNYILSSQRSTMLFTSVGNNKLALIANSNSSGVAQDIYFSTLGTNATFQMQIKGNTGNVQIGTNTDAGFKLDVNGTARFTGAVTTLAFTTSSNYLGVNSNTGGGIYGITQNNTWYIWNRRNNTSGDGIGIDDFNTNGGSNTNLNVLNIGGSFQTTGTCSHSNLAITRTINLASGTQTIRGIYYNPTLTNTTGLTSHFALHSTSGGILINSASPNASAIIQADSTTQGFLPPRMTTTQKNAIASPATGLMVYDTTLNLMSVYNGTTWITL